MEYYAHSGKSEIGIGCQLYKHHIDNVVSIAEKNVVECLKYSSLNDSDKIFFKEVVLVASYYHDVGKLDDTIQSVLRSPDYSDEKILNHVDAGIAICVELYESTKNLVYLIAAYFIKCHHLGLDDFPECIIERPGKWPGGTA